MELKPNTSIPYGAHDMTRRACVEVEQEAVMGDPDEILAEGEADVREVHHVIEYRCSCGEEFKDEHSAANHLYTHNHLHHHLPSRRIPAEMRVYSDETMAVYSAFMYGDFK
jgi:hypothetical protein